MKRAGHIMLQLAEGVETRAPAHLDLLDGSKRAESSVDGDGRIDRTILSKASGLRAKRCYHAAANLGRSGARHTCFDATETELGMDRVLSVHLAENQPDDDLVKALNDLDSVQWATVEPLSSVPFLTDTTGRNPGSAQSAYDRVGAVRALEMEPGSRTIAVAVIDTGVALEHSEFRHRLRAGYDTVDLGLGPVSEGVSLVGDSLGRDFCARDETGHGSHVAGIIGARGLGINPGVAGQSPIIPVRALAAARAKDGSLFGVGGLSDIDAAIKVAVDLGARVLNMSFGTSRRELDPSAPPPHGMAVSYALAHGCICVAAIGNSGEREDYYPAALSGCIAVGSADADGNRSAFSTTGDHIDLVAPGENILSADLGGGYRQSTGTSHAAPFVAGAAALLASRAERRGQVLSPEDTRQILTTSATTRPGVGPNPETGSGILNIPAALSELDQMSFQTKEVNQ